MHIHKQLGTENHQDAEQKINMQTIIVSGADAIHMRLVIIGQVEKYQSLRTDLFSVKPNNVEHSNFSWNVITDNQVGAKYLCLPRITTALGS